jgi:hypothetical protein
MARTSDPRLAVLLPLVIAAVAAAAAGDARAQSTYIIHLAPNHPALSAARGVNGGAAVLGRLLPRRLRAPRPRVL